MRTALVLTALLVAGCGLAGCGTGDGARERDDPNLIRGDDVERRDLRRVEEMLRGQVAGVHVEERNGALAIRIRGGDTPGLGTNDPLFVIDGVPIQPGVGGALDGIAPYDIESIRVLKSAAETAAYGARGANGVVLITTVRPPRPASDGS